MLTYKIFILRYKRKLKYIIKNHPNEQNVKKNVLNFLSCTQKIKQYALQYSK